MIKIQLVDDERNVLSALQRVLRREGWDVHPFSDVEEALTALGTHDYAVIVVDYQMPQINGVTYLQFAKQRQPNAVRMVLSAHGDRHSMMQAINLAEVYRFLSKPWDEYEILAAMRSAIDLHMLRSENERLLDQVRRQQLMLDRQSEELMRLERDNPGITHVDRDREGNLVIGDLVDDGG